MSAAAAAEDEARALDSQRGLGDSVDFVGMRPHDDVIGRLSTAAALHSPERDRGRRRLGRRRADDSARSAGHRHADRDDEARGHPARRAGGPGRLAVRRARRRRARPVRWSPRCSSRRRRAPPMSLAHHDITQVALRLEAIYSPVGRSRGGPRMKIVHLLGWYFPDSVGGTEVYVEGSVPAAAGRGTRGADRRARSAADCRRQRTDVSRRARLSISDHGPPDARRGLPPRRDAGSRASVPVARRRAARHPPRAQHQDRRGPARVPGGAPVSASGSSPPAICRVSATCAAPAS